MTNENKPLLILTTDLTNPWNNLALEEYLMGLCESDLTEAGEHPYGAVLFLWQNRHTVVIGQMCIRDSCAPVDLTSC